MLLCLAVFNVPKLSRDHSLFMYGGTCREHGRRWWDGRAMGGWSYCHESWYNENRLYTICETYTEKGAPLQNSKWGSPVQTAPDLVIIYTNQNLLFAYLLTYLLNCPSPKFGVIMLYLLFCIKRIHAEEILTFQRHLRWVMGHFLLRAPIKCHISITEGAPAGHKFPVLLQLDLLMTSTSYQLKQELSYRKQIARQLHKH